MSTAARVAVLRQSSAAHKRKHPERFCADPRCLWRTHAHGEFKPCPKHMSTIAYDVFAIERSLSILSKGLA